MGFVWIPRFVGCWERVWWPLGLVAIFVLVGRLVEATGIVRGFYASPFVLCVVLATLHGGARSGYLATVASALSFNFFFVNPPLELTWPKNEEWIAYGSMLAAAYVIGRMLPQDPAPKSCAAFWGRLPFVRGARDGDDTSQSYWDVATSGNWIADCRLGQEYGRIYLDARTRYGAPLLGWVVRDMIGHGRWSGVEAGFFGAISMGLPCGPASILLANDNAEDLE